MRSNGFTDGVAGKTRVKRLLKRIGLPLGLRVGIFAQHRPIPLRVAPLPSASELLTDWPVISMVTPSLNQRRFLDTTIRSVTEQRYPRLEYFVIDGGSKDGSDLLIRAHENELAYWCSQRDRGQAHAVNQGFLRSTGSIMGWLNADDVLMPGSLAFVARWFKEHPEVDVVYSHRVVIDEDGREVGRWILPRHSSSALMWRDYVPQETMFWRRSIWERIGGALNEELDFAMDWDLVMRFHQAGAKFARLPAFLAAFRNHPNQKSVELVETVGRAEFTRVRGNIAALWPSRFLYRARSALYVLRSMIYTWLYATGIHPRHKMENCCKNEPQAEKSPPAAPLGLK